MAEQLPGKRSFEADFLKTYAILGVVMIHVSAGELFEKVGTFDWYAALFFATVLRGAVPAFLMATGSLMLDPEHNVSVKRLWTHHIPRLYVALMFWAFLYKVRDLFVYGNDRTAGELIQAVKDVLLFRHMDHLYYLHIALLVYALIPILRLIAFHAGKRSLEYCIVLWVILGIIYPSVRYTWPFIRLDGIPLQYMLNLSYSSVGYVLLGWYLHRHARTPWKWGVLAGVGMVIMFVGTSVLSMDQNYLNSEFLGATHPAFAAMSTGVCGWIFATFRRKRVGERLTRVTTYLSKASFCIYLVHIFVLQWLQEMDIAGTTGPCLIWIPLVFALVFAGSLAIYFVLSKIPVVNRWLI